MAATVEVVPAFLVVQIRTRSDVEWSRRVCHGCASKSTAIIASSVTASSTSRKLIRIAAISSIHSATSESVYGLLEPLASLISQLRRLVPAAIRILPPGIETEQFRLILQDVEGRLPLAGLERLHEEKPALLEVAVEQRPSAVVQQLADQMVAALNVVPDRRFEIP